MNASKCSRCQKIPDDILMLQCSHDLCLACAAKSFALQTMQPKRNKKEFHCDLCGTTTELDTNSVYELEKLHLTTTLNDRSNRKPNPQLASRGNSDKQIKVKSTTKTENKENSKSGSTFLGTGEKCKRWPDADTRTSLHQSQRHLSKNQSENSFIANRGFCPDHPDEEVSYFCFDCLNKCICPECIIHGIHKNHEVKTIKKSYPLVKKQLEEQIEQNNQWIAQVENQRQDLEKRSAQCQATQEQYKLSIQNEFQGLQKLLVQKQQEIIEQIDSQPTLYFNHENYFNRLNEVESKLNLFNEQISEIIYQKDECGLLNYFGSIQGQLTPTIPPAPQIKEQNPSNHVFLQLNEIKKLVSQLDSEYNSN